MIAAAFFQSILQGFDLQSVAQFSAARMLNCTAAGIGIAFLAWVLLRGLERQNSGTRFAVWFAALLGIAALPMIGHLGTSGTELAKPSGITLPASWAFYLFAGWLLFAAIGLVRIGVGFWRLRQLRKTCTPIEAAALDPLLRKTLDEFDSVRAVSICVSDRLRVPTAIGFIKPLVVIPSWAVRELSAVELNAILLHELAHLRRWDDWTNLIQKIVGALLFFHPAVWWIEKKLALEREMACDDLVLANTTSPRAYAECLVSLAEKSLLRRGFALAQAAVGRVRHISLRVAQILDEKRPRATRVWRPAPLLLTGMSLACLMVFSDAPRLVSFETGSSSLAATTTAAAGNEIDQFSRMGSHVVPAKFVVQPQANATALVPARIAAATTSPRMSAGISKEQDVNKSRKLANSGVVPARATQRAANPAKLVRTDFAGEAVAPQTLIFVMQSARYDASGVVWDVCVWRVTVTPVRNQVEPGIAAKSI
jgi:BlaR1 peptidase M56